MFPYFCSIYFFGFNLRFLLSPYFDHDMHHALHVLDALG